MWTYKCDRADAPTEYDGKPIFTQENFDYSKAEIGDYVEQAVVDDAMDCLPPASMSARCAQMGEPYSTGRTRRPGGSVPPTTRSSVWPERGLTVSGSSAAAASRARPSPAAGTRSTAERGPER